MATLIWILIFLLIAALGLAMIGGLVFLIIMLIKK